MLNKLDLNKIFNDIEEPFSENEINFEKVLNFEGVYVGKRFGNFPVIFFKSDIFNFIGIPSEKFSNIKISRGVNNIISILDEKIHGPFFSFELISSDFNLVQYFFTLISDLIIFYSQNPENFKIRGYIESIENLFADVVEILDDEVIGLFGELLFIHSSSDRNRMIDFWHLPLNNRFDFSSGYEKVEIKSTCNKIREHYFSLEQVADGLDMDVLICSILVRRVHHGGGKSIDDLIREISCDLNSLKLNKFNEIISQITRGLEVKYKFRDYKFDYESALNSMIFFDTSSLPKICESDVPKEVCCVKFKEILDESSSILVSDLKCKENNLFSMIKK